MKRVAHAIGERIDVVIGALALAAFVLQARYLHEAGASYTDEGVYAQAGRSMMHGAMLYRDVILNHVPLLPVLMGIGLFLTKSLFPLRLAYLAFNCAVAVPLGRVLHRWFGFWPAVMGVVWYFSYHEMMHHDFRFLAIRQLANGFFILFLYAATFHPKTRAGQWAMALWALCASWTYLQMAPHLLFMGIALYPPRRLREVHPAILWPVVAGCTMVAFLALMPFALQRTVIDLGGRVFMPMGQRWLWMFSGIDAVFYAAAGVGLLLLVLTKRWRGLGLGCIAVVLSVVCLPVQMLYHYPVGAAPIAAIGIAGGARALWLLARRYWFLHVFVTAGLLALTFWQLHITAPSLLGEWAGNRHPSLPALRAAIDAAPEPVLSVVPVFFAEADKDLVTDLEDIYQRPPTPGLITFERYRAAATKACSIFAASPMPVALQEEFTQRYRVVLGTEFGTLLATDHPGCTAKKPR